MNIKARIIQLVLFIALLGVIWNFIKSIVPAWVLYCFGGGLLVIGILYIVVVNFIVKEQQEKALSTNIKLMKD